ncbi:MAG TPA: helix-turn-helix domain-containing protein [Haliangiales bacterium]|nr:helix-turn-helix domain-containing protein [Haliangiales bacterium]
MPEDPKCRAFETAIEVLGRPWTGKILNSLQAGPLRFSEIGEATAGVGDKTLSARLKDLEGRGIIVRSVEAGPPVRVVYALTPRGEAFIHVSEAIRRWGDALLAELPAPQRVKAR